MAERWNNRAIFHLLWPLIIEMLLAVTMGAADTIMVSFVGEAAVSGVNIVDNINNLLIIAFAALAMGGAVVVSQYIGRRDTENANLASRQLIYIVTLVALGIMVVAIAFRRPIIYLLYGKIGDDVMQAASVYFLITAISYPFLGISNANAAIFRSMGNSKITMLISVVVNIVNISGNFFFIYGLKLGVAGAAFSTLLSRIIAAFITLILLIRNKRGSISLVGILKIKLKRTMIVNILNIGIPSGVENSMFQIGRLLTQRIFTVFGTSAMAGNAIAGVINSFSFMPGMAFGMALITIVGQCIGARDFVAAKRNTKKILTYTHITIAVMTSLIFIFMEPLINLFSLSATAHEYAKTFLTVHCISMTIGWSLSFALPNSLRAAGDVKYVMIVATVSMWTVRVSAAYLLTFVFKLGPLGVWLAMGADFIVRGTFYLVRWIGGKWQKKTVIKD